MLLAQRDVRTGETLLASVRVIVKRRVQIRGLYAEWVGREEARFGKGEHTARKTLRVPEASVEILGATRLEAGQHEYPFSLSIPDFITPSYSGRKCSTVHSLVLRLEIPWWLDRRTTFELPVQQGRAQRRYPGEAILFASREAGPEAKKPYIEGSLATDVVAPGDLLRGAVALLNTDHNRYTKLSVALIGTEFLHDGNRREHGDVHRLSVEIESRAPEEGQSFPLALRLPQGIPASARGSLWSMSWFFEVNAGVRFGRDESLRIPVTVAPGHLHSDTNLLRPAPRVGSARQVALWQSVAAANDMHCASNVMHASLGDVHLEVSRQHFGRRGWSLIATFAFPSLRLGAQVREASLLRGTGFGGIKILRGVWARAHHISARSEEQALPIFSALAAHFSCFAVVRMDDSSLRVELSGSGLRRRKLKDFVLKARACAQALGEIRGIISAPAEFSETFAAWGDFASRLRGQLNVGDMSMTASYRGLVVELSHEWLDGSLRVSTIRVVGLSNQQPEACFAIEASGPDGLSEPQLAQNIANRELLVSALEGALSFESRADDDVLIVPPLVDPKNAMRRVGALVKFSSGRAPKTGPYR